MYKVLASKRKALGLTQTEIGELAGVNASTVSNLEAGMEVSIPVFNSVKMAIENQFTALDRLEYMEAMLKMHTIQLGDLEGEERILCLGYISIYSNKLQMELLRADKKKD
jgi:transcriptional regulator with XRE-family HTH domain